MKVLLATLILAISAGNAMATSTKFMEQPTKPSHDATHKNRAQKQHD